MTTLQGQKIVVIGGSSGIGYALTKAVLLASADHVTIASSSQSKVDNAVQELLAEAALKLREDLGRRIVGKVLDLRETQNIRNFFEEIGELDHLVITAGTRGGMGGEFKTKDVDKLKGLEVSFISLNKLADSCCIQVDLMKDFGDPLSPHRVRRFGLVEA